MNHFLLGLAALPAAAVLAALLYLLFQGTRYVCEHLFSPIPRIGRRVYAYRVSSLLDPSGKCDGLLGSVFIERRNLGARYSYVIEHSAGSRSIVGAQRVPGGGELLRRDYAEWDRRTAILLDLPAGIDPEVANEIQRQAWAQGREFGHHEYLQRGKYLGKGESLPAADAVNPFELGAKG